MALGEIKKVEEMNYFELLAWLGIGSSHPGGFPATKKNLEIMNISPNDYILDAGCGSGLTACHLAKTLGCKIMGIDINPQMIEKATMRAKRENVSHLVEFQVADVNNLPFPANHFDLVMGESITVFLDKVKVYKEFFRVLKPEGRVADLEMALLSDLPPHLRKELGSCFGTSTDPLSYEEWQKALSEAGFVDVEIKNTEPLKNNSNMVMNELKQDWMLIKDLSQKVANQPGLIGRLQKNADFMKKYRSYFGYGLVYGRKPVPKKKTIKETIFAFLPWFQK